MRSRTRPLAPHPEETMARKTAGQTTKRPAARKTPAKKTAGRKGGKTAAKPQEAVGARVDGCDQGLRRETPEGPDPAHRRGVSDAKRGAEILRQGAGRADDRLTSLAPTASADRPGQPAEPPGQRPTYENIVGA